MATSPPGGADPRVFAPPPAEGSVLPIVAKPRSGLPGWAVGAGIIVAGVLLFTMLDTRRRAMEAPSVRVRGVDQLATTSAPPPLYVPPDLTRAPTQTVLVPTVRQPVPVPAPAPARPAPPQIIYVPQPFPVPTPSAEPMPPPQRVATEPALVVDTGLAAPAAAATAASGEAATAAAATAPADATAGPARVRAGAFANRSTTVAQGTLIPAVLETALDSTRPGFARAIVSRDVRGFDGSRVLVPRGSRLIGEYRSDVARGQRRAMVNWTRLIRPDGVTIAIGSPATDPLGGGGIRARVNSHFFERFGGALLQSVLGLGSALAGGALAGDGGVVILPNAVEGLTQIVQPSQVTPTLTVRQGTSISIFVARDLDFTGAGTRQ